MSKIIAQVDLQATIKGGDEWDQVDGVRIVYTDGTTTEFGISMKSNCCESFDYLHSVDNPDEYIGAELVSVEEVDTWPAAVKNLHSEYGYDEGGFQAIRVNTNKGSMDFVVYNCHNGYYSHTTLFKNDGEVKKHYL